MGELKSTYRLDVYDSVQVVAIEDLNMGERSVTNDIENVIEEVRRIMNKTGRNIERYQVIYKDSEGLLDGYGQNSGQFISLGVSCCSSCAIDKIIHKN